MQSYVVASRADRIAVFPLAPLITYDISIAQGMFLPCSNHPLLNKLLGKHHEFISILVFRCAKKTTGRKSMVEIWIPNPDLFAIVYQYL